MVEVLFFGRMADVAGRRQMQVEVGASLLALRDRVFADALNGGAISARDIRMSINRTVVTADQPLQAGDEVAFFSVFSGG